MSDTAIISLVIGGLSGLTWLLGLSYQLGRTTAKLDGLADAFAKMEGTTDQIFAKLEVLAGAVPHRCQHLQCISEMHANIDVLKRQVGELEAWRHSFERTL